MKKLLLALSVVVVMPVVGAPTLYKSVGPDGNAVYSDKPPADGKVEKTLKFEDLPSSAVPAATLTYVEQLKRLKESAAAPPQGVVLYSATWCGYCKQAKAYLAGKSIAYREFDVDSAAGKASFAQTGGSRGIPLLFVNGQRLQGFSAPAYDAVFTARR